MTDRVRTVLEHERAAAEQRVTSAVGSIVRMLAGGVPLWSDRIKSARSELARAIQERTIARELLRELHIVDGEHT